tara:strand:- start:116 stop:364 length:249 start_codon:yes stop_codon:yes gene_type:complete
MHELRGVRKPRVPNYVKATQPLGSARRPVRAAHLAAGARHVAVGLGDLEVLDPVLQVLRPSEAEHERVTAGAEGSDEAARTW